MKVDSLEFLFPDGCQAWKYDEFLFFKRLSNAFQFRCECEQCPSRECRKVNCPDFGSCSRRKTYDGLKGIDLILQQAHALILIEVKDYRKQTNPPLEHIADEVAKKFRDTLFGLWTGSIFSDLDEERNRLHAWRAASQDIRLIFHFESPRVPYSSGLYPQGQLVPLELMTRMLKRRLGPWGSKLEVVNAETLRAHRAHFGWSVLEAQN